MKSEISDAKAYLVLSEEGIDIDTCEIDFSRLSVACQDLSRYRKALRVKIRAILKHNDLQALQRYADALFSLALFAKYLYGFHSCSSDVELWQQQDAKSLQKSFDITNCTLYDGTNWLSYEHSAELSSRGIQDHKPFLTLKDKAHFDRLF